MARLLPGVSGVAKVNPSLIVLGMPIRLPVTVDLILVPALFVLLYTAVILLYPRGEVSRWREVPYRLGAIGASVIIIACCVTFGCLLSLVLEDHVSKSVVNSFESLGMNADLFLHNKTVPLHGNAIALLGLLIGTLIAFSKIGRGPVVRRRVQLTREQRMTPYRRMMQERRQEGKFGLKEGGVARPEGAKVGVVKKVGNASRLLCRSEPLPTLEPEAVGYRPLT
jgi:hypothetical protein